jgi:precorrin-2 dehydrogenase / sirohydrochlorin ferrochelatase
MAIQPDTLPEEISPRGTAPDASGRAASGWGECDRSDGGQIDEVPEPLAPSLVDGPLYPVGLVVRGRRCLVVGGGRVAASKVRALLQCGAVVTVVAREVHDALRLVLEERTTGETGEQLVDVQQRAYERGEAAGYRLVLAATGDPGIDAAVYEDAEAAGTWVNSADDPAHCSVVLPAVWRTGAVTVSVATDGSSPALSAWLRTQVAESIGEHVGQLAALLAEARRQLKEEGRPTSSVNWVAILEGPVPAWVAEGRLADARAAISAVIGSTAASTSCRARD